MKKLFTFILAITCGLFLKAQTSTAPSGDGSVSNPYQIATLDNLYWLSQDTCIWNDTLYYIQTADIDASDTKNWNDGKGFAPIGSVDSIFIGHYNGKGYAISNLYCNYDSKYYVGLFGRAGSSEIDSLVLKDCSISGHVYVGALVGKVGGTTIKNCYVQNGTVSGTSVVGGLTGSFVNSTVMYSYGYL